jgi:hypothetical protein
MDSIPSGHWTIMVKEDTLIILSSSPDENGCPYTVLRIRE